jgi:hypothetical protein
MERVHGTTRERPSQRLLVERPRLRALPPHPFDTDIVIPMIVSKEARVRFDSNTYSVPPDLVGKTVQVRADDHRVRVMCDGVEVAAHTRSWDKRRHIEDHAHVQKLLDRRKAARGPSRRERLLDFCPEARVYLQEIARRRIRLDHEYEKLFRLIDRYGQTEVAGAIAKAVAQRSFGVRYVQTLCDQAASPAAWGYRGATTRVKESAGPARTERPRREVVLACSIYDATTMARCVIIAKHMCGAAVASPKARRFGSLIPSAARPS